MIHAKKELRVLAVVSLAVVLGASAAPQETAGGLRYFTRAALESADMGGIAEYIDATLAKCPAAFAAATDLAATRTGRERDALVLRVELARNLETYVRAYHTRKPEARDRELMAWQGAKEMDNFLAYFAAERLRDGARAELPPPVTLDVRAFGDMQVVSHSVLHHDDVNAVNTEYAPDNVIPFETEAAADISEIKLPTASWNVIRLCKK